MQHTADRNHEGACDNEERRVAELAKYASMSPDALEEAISEQMIMLDEWLMPDMEDAEQQVADMRLLHTQVMAVTPDMEDELSEANLRWDAARCRAQMANDILADLEQAQSAAEQIWGDVPSM